MQPLLCRFLHSAVTSSLVGLNIPVSTLFSNTLSVCCFLEVRDHVSLEYVTMGKTVMLQAPQLALCYVTHSARSFLQFLSLEGTSWLCERSEQ